MYVLCKVMYHSDTLDQSSTRAHTIYKKAFVGEIFPIFSGKWLFTVKVLL